LSDRGAHELAHLDYDLVGNVGLRQELTEAREINDMGEPAPVRRQMAPAALVSPREVGLA
jgi:hypothetical protein